MEISSEIGEKDGNIFFIYFGFSAAPKAVLEAEAASWRHLFVIPIFSPFFGTSKAVKVLGGRCLSV
jgi:hypothetical protein